MISGTLQYATSWFECSRDQLNSKWKDLHVENNKFNYIYNNKSNIRASDKSNVNVLNLTK